MKVGDLVKLKSSATRRAFLVTACRILRNPSGHNMWFKVLGCDDWQSAADFEVISEGR